MERKRKQIQLFGENLCLYERTYAQVQAYLNEAAELSNDKSIRNALAVSNLAVMIVSRSLEPNKKEIQQGSFFLKIRHFSKYRKTVKEIEAFNKKLSVEYIVKNLSQAQIMHYANEVLKLEGFETPENGKKSKKKAPASRLVKESPDQS